MKKNESYNPIIHGIIAAALALNLWYLSSIAITEVILPKYYSTVFDIFLVLAGASLAYFFRAFEVNRIETKTRITILNKALATHIRKIQILEELDSDLSDWKDKDKFNRAMEAPPFLLPSYPSATHDMTDLDFLVELGEAETYMDAVISQECFEQATNAIEKRSQYFDREIVPIISELDEKNIPAYVTNVRNALGNEREKRLIHVTDEMYEVIPRSLNTITRNLDRLYLCGKRSFPKRKLIYYNHKEPPQT